MLELDNNIVFSLIKEKLGKEIELVDRAVIIWESEQEHFLLSTPSDMDIIQPLLFFERKKNDFHFVQLGEFLSFEHLETDKPFVAYTRRDVDYCEKLDMPIREILAYKP